MNAEQELPTSLPDLIKELSAAENEYKTAAAAYQTAGSRETTAINRLNAAQKAVDAWMEQAKKDAHPRSDWASPRGDRVMDLMTPLPEIAADVAQALGLRSHIDHWSDYTFQLEKDGSNLTEAYWFKRCCEWLNTHGLGLNTDPSSHHDHVAFSIDDNVHAQCDFALAPAALVSAVWRKQQEKQNG